MRLVRRQPRRRRGRPVEGVVPFDIRQIQPSFSRYETKQGTWWGHMAEKGDSKDEFLRALQALGSDILNHGISPSVYGFPAYRGATINVTQPEHRYHIFAHFDRQQFLRTVVWFEASESYVASASSRPPGPPASRVSQIHTAHGEIPLAHQSSTAAPLAAIIYKILGPPSPTWGSGLLALPVWDHLEGGLPFPLIIAPEDLLLVAMGDDDLRDEIGYSEHPMASAAQALEALDNISSDSFSRSLPDLFSRHGTGEYDIEFDSAAGEITLQADVKGFWENEHRAIDNIEEHLSEVLGEGAEEQLEVLAAYAKTDKWELFSELRNGWTTPTGVDVPGIWGHKKHDPYRGAPKPDEQRKEGDPVTNFPDEVWFFRANLLTDFGAAKTLDASEVTEWIYGCLADIDHFQSWFYDGFQQAYASALEAVVDAAYGTIPQAHLDLLAARKRRTRLRDTDWGLEFRTHQAGRANRRTKGIGHLLLRHQRMRRR